MTPGQLGPMRRVFVEIDGGGGANHVDHGNAFGDADDKRDFSVGGFENGVGGVRRRDKNHGSVGASGLHSFLNGVEYRAIKMLCSTFAGSHATDDIRAVFNHLLRVKSAFASGETLHD